MLISLIKFHEYLKINFQRIDFSIGAFTFQFITIYVSTLNNLLIKYKLCQSKITILRESDKEFFFVSFQLLRDRDLLVRRYHSRLVPRILYLHAKLFLNCVVIGVSQMMRQDRMLRAAHVGSSDRLQKLRHARERCATERGLAR